LRRQRRVDIAHERTAAGAASWRRSAAIARNVSNGAQDASDEKGLERQMSVAGQERCRETRPRRLPDSGARGARDAAARGRPSSRVMTVRDDRMSSSKLRPEQVRPRRASPELWLMQGRDQC